MAQTATKIAYPTGQDPFQPHRDMKALAESAKVIVPVANRAEADDIANIVNPTPQEPLFVNYADTGVVERHNGTRWDSIGGDMRQIIYREADIFASLESGVSISSGEAVALVDHNGVGMVNVRFSVQNLSVQSGTGRWVIGELRPELRTGAAIPLHGYYSVGAVIGAVSGLTGEVSVRWSTGTNTFDKYMAGAWSLGVYGT